MARFGDFASFGEVVAISVPALFDGQGTALLDAKGRVP
jgi:hypothetical protein